MKHFFSKHSKKILLFLFLVISFFRIWIICSTNWYINIDTYYDSHLQINQAINILSGNWLGGYDRFVLAKNPTYPIFLALLYILHIPYAYGIGLLMIVASLMFVIAIKPMIKNDYLKLIIYAFILFNPVCREVTYHYRNALLPWLVLICISCIIAIYIRRKENVKKILPFSIIGMVSTGAFWLLREDSIWFLPFLIVAYIISIVTVVVEKFHKDKIIIYAALALIPLLGIPIFSNTVSYINYKSYGIYATNDRMQTNTAKLLGTLISIDDGSNLDKDVWISTKTINIAKKVSPTFSSLNLEAFDNWSKYGDHSIWALRDVLTNSGYFVDAKKTDNVCKKIIAELEKGFKDGKIKKKKGIQLSDTSGVFSINEVIKSFIPSFDVLKYHLTYSGLKNDEEKVINYSDDIDLHLYEEVLGISIIRDENLIADNPYYMDSHNMFKIQNENHKNSLRHNRIFSNMLLYLYKYTSIILFILATVGLIYVIYKSIKKDKKLEYKIEAIVMMIGFLLLSYLNAYLICLWATAFLPGVFHDITYNYTIVERLLISLYEIIGFIYFVEMIKEFMISKKTNKTNKTNKQLSEIIHLMLKLDFKNLFRTKTDNIYIQFFRYIFVGGIAAVVNIGMLYIFTDIIKIYYVISNILSFTLGLIVNYLLSKKFVFQEKTKISKTKEFIIYAIIGIIGLGIDTMLIWLFTDIFSIYYILSKIISTAIVFIWNFGARKVLYKVMGEN